MINITYVTGNYGKYVSVKERAELENIKIGSDTMFSTTAKIIIALIIIGIGVGLFLILKKTNEG